jgi:CubicO group peptidase (beta-lactamase class C family)
MRGALTIGQPTMAGPDSLYRIYSMTKPITGMAAMMLIDEGKLGLDQPIAELLPAYAKMRVLKNPSGPLEDTVAAERPITVRHLLTHTAGLGYNIVSKGPIKAAYERYGLLPGQVSRLSLPGFGDYQTIAGLDKFADGLARMPLVYQPGTKWSYSVSLDLLGRVIEVAAKQPFDRFLDQRIFKPCGMTSTWFRVPASEVDRLTTNYGILNGTPVPMDPARASIYLDPPAFPFGGAGLVSSPRDYDRFLMMLAGLGAIGGRRVMSERAVRLGTSNLLPAGVNTAGTFAAGSGFGAGGRSSDGNFGWGGAAGTVAFVNVGTGLRGNLMTQYMPSEAWPVHSAFPAAVLKDLAAKGPAKKVAA